MSEFPDVEVPKGVPRGRETFDYLNGNVLRLFEKASEYVVGGVLEIGPGNREFSVTQPDWHTLDIKYDSTLTYYGVDPYDYPIEDSRYDTVVAVCVMEHIPMIWRWMREVSRILSPNGHLIAVTPINWPIHAAPVDCWRIYPDGMRALMDDSGMKPIMVHSSSGGTPPETVDMLSIGRKL